MSQGIRRRGKRSWEIQIELGDDPVTRRRRRAYISVKGTRRDAERAQIAALHLRDIGVDIAPERTAVADYLDRWLRDHAAPRIAESTFETYRSIVVNHLVPALGSVRLDRLRPSHIQSMYAASLRKGLSRRTVLHHHRVLRNALQQAVRWQLLAQNPADAVTPPRPERTEMKVLNEDDVRALLASSKGTSIEPLLNLAIATGARQGELIALRWEDTDLERGLLHIRRSARTMPGRGVVMGSPKTHRSTRPVALSQGTVANLSHHRAMQSEHRLRLGEVWEDHGLVFPSERGTPQFARNLTRSFKRVLEEAGLDQNIRFHDLRHTSATLMLRAGVHPKVVSERLGHSTVSITLDTYSHVLPDTQKEAAGALDHVLVSPRTA